MSASLGSCFSPTPCRRRGASLRNARNEVKLFQPGLWRNTQNEQNETGRSSCRRYFAPADVARRSGEPSHRPSSRDREAETARGISASVPIELRHQRVSAFVGLFRACDGVCWGAGDRSRPATFLMFPSKFGQNAYRAETPTLSADLEWFQTNTTFFW